MKNLYVKNVGGRFGNQLYFVLQAFKYSKKYNNEIIKYIANDACKIFNLQKYFFELNLSNYFCDTQLQTENSIELESENYYQIFDKDFSLDDLNEFISETILQSNSFKQAKELFKNTIEKNSMCINIRNGDYLTLPQFNCFNRIDYINTCLSYINVNHTPHKFKNIYVISDDNTINKKLYDNIFKSKFDNVIYIHNDNIITELLLISLFKCKIIWNSTFSYWSAFIGNAYYKDNYNITFSPSAFTWGDDNSSHCNKLWLIINTPINNRP